MKNRIKFIGKIKDTEFNKSSNRLKSIEVIYFPEMEQEQFFKKEDGKTYSLSRMEAERILRKIYKSGNTVIEIGNADEIKIAKFCLNLVKSEKIIFGSI